VINSGATGFVIICFRPSSVSRSGSCAAGSGSVTAGLLCGQSPTSGKAIVGMARFCEPKQPVKENAQMFGALQMLVQAH
jgi:hypothetical protein